MIFPALMHAISFGGQQTKGFGRLAQTSLTITVRSACGKAQRACESAPTTLNHDALPERLPVHLLASWWRVPTSNEDRGR